MSKTKTRTVRGFGHRLERLIYDNDLNCVEVGKRIGKDRKTVYSYRDGESMPDGVTICRLCDVLHTTPNYLLWGKK